MLCILFVKLWRNISAFTYLTFDRENATVTKSKVNEMDYLLTSVNAGRKNVVRWVKGEVLKASFLQAMVLTEYKYNASGSTFARVAWAQVSASTGAADGDWHARAHRTPLHRISTNPRRYVMRTSLHPRKLNKNIILCIVNSLIYGASVTNLVSTCF